MSGEYEDVAASQNDTLLGGSGDGPGQELSHIIIFPATTSPGLVAIADGEDEKTIFPGGADSVGSLIPFTVFLVCKSQNGGWRVTTGANVSVRAVGDFN